MNRLWCISFILAAGLALARPVLAQDTLYVSGSQDGATITGWVTRDDIGVPVEDALVQAIGPVTSATQTDESGAFELIVPAGDYEVIATYAGFWPDSALLQLDDGVAVEVPFSLRPSPNASVTPDAFVLVIPEGEKESDEQTLTIENLHPDELNDGTSSRSGPSSEQRLAGDSILHWVRIGWDGQPVSPPECEVWKTNPVVYQAYSSGELAHGESVSIAVWSTQGPEPGVHHKLLCLETNDPGSQLIMLPVTIYDRVPFSEGFSLTVNAAGMGAVHVHPEQPFYQTGEEVTLTALPAPNWTFIGWSGDAAGNDNPLVLIIEGDTEVTASFEAEEPPPDENEIFIDRFEQ